MNPDAQPCTRFPAPPAGFASSLADEPLLLDGLRVVFDEKVALVPVTLSDPEDAHDVAA